MWFLIAGGVCLVAVGVVVAVFRRQWAENAHRAGVVGSASPGSAIAMGLLFVFAGVVLIIVGLLRAPSFDEFGPSMVGILRSLGDGAIPIAIALTFAGILLLGISVVRIDRIAKRVRSREEAHPSVGERPSQTQYLTAALPGGLGVPLLISGVAICVEVWSA